MHTIYTELMDSYQRLKERKYTVLEQEQQKKGGGKYGNMPWAIPNEEFDQNRDAIIKMADDAENNSLKIVEKPKETVNQMYTPTLLQKDTNRVWWLGLKGPHTANIRNFIDYIRSKEQDQAEGQQQLDAEAQEAAEQDSLDNAPLPWQPAQLSQAMVDKIQGLKASAAIPGYDLPKIVDLILGDPNQGGSKTRKFFSQVYTTPETRSMMPAVQLELVSVFTAFSEIAGKAHTREDGTKVIKDELLSPTERDILDAAVCRAEKKGGLFWGKNGSERAIASVAPEFLAWTRTLKSEFLKEPDRGGTYSMAFSPGRAHGAPGGVLCDFFSNAVIEKNGEDKPAVGKSSESRGGNKVAQTLGTHKEHLMVGVLQVAFRGMESGALDDLVDDWNQFTKTINEVCARNDDIEAEMPVAGILEAEDSQETYDLMAKATGIDGCGDIAKSYIKDSITEALALAKLVKSAGVRPAEIRHEGKGSTSNDKADFTLVLASPEDADKLFAHMEKMNIDVSREDNLSISLKAYTDFVGSDRKLGTGGYQKNSRYYGITNCSDVAPQFKGECEEVIPQAGKIRKAIETNKFFKDVPDKGGLLKSMDKASKADQDITRTTVDLLFNKKGRTSAGNVIKTVISDFKKLPKTPEGQRLLNYFKVEGTNVASMNRVKVAEFTAQMVRMQRLAAVHKDPSLIRGFAANDLVTSCMTAADEAITLVGKGRVSMTGIYKVCAHVLTNCDAHLTSGSGYAFYDREKATLASGKKAKRGKKWGGGALRHKDGRLIVDSGVSPEVILAISKFLGESVEGSDDLIESIHRKLNELVEAIHVAVVR